MIAILTWISIGAGGLLILLMLLSLIGGLDLDLDLGDTDVDVDSSGSLGLVKSFLTFVSVSTWVMKILMTGNMGTTIALLVGVLSGTVAVFLLGWLFNTLLKNQVNVNWKLEDSLFKEAKVYLKIPAGGKNGIIQAELNGAMREMKALSDNGHEIETGEMVMIQEVRGNVVVVSKV